MGSSSEYSYRRLASRLQRLARWKCLETREMIKPLEYGKCLETGETTKSLSGGSIHGNQRRLDGVEGYLGSLSLQYGAVTLFWYSLERHDL